MSAAVARRLAPMPAADVVLDVRVSLAPIASALCEADGDPCSTPALFAVDDDTIGTRTMLCPQHVALQLRDLADFVIEETRAAGR